MLQDVLIDLRILGAKSINILLAPYDSKCNSVLDFY